MDMSNTSAPTTDGRGSKLRDDCRRDGLRGRGDEKDVVLESFFYSLTGNINNFRNLTNLRLKVFIAIGQPVVSLDGIEQLKNLTELWVCECFLQDASSVSGCLELKKLHLYCNQLRSIPKVSNLNILTFASFASNNITVLTPSLAESLRELNLADNDITDLSYLVMCKQLEILNLAGNNVRTLSALVPLMKLKKLRYLYFIDQMYKFSLVSSLVNYRSFVIYNMEQLKCLDSVQIESEERENSKNFFERKFRYYRVLYNNHLNAFFKDHRKLLSQSFKELNNLRNAIMSVTVTLSKASDASTIGKECRKRQQKYEVCQFHWECKCLDWIPKLEKELDVKCTLMEMEMTLSGNVNFFYYGKEACNLTNSVCQMMQSFICPYTKRNLKLVSIEIDQVIHIVNTQHHCFDKFEGVKEVLGIGVNESQFFVIGDPVNVTEASRWPFTFLKNYVTMKGADSIKCTVTNSVAIADSEWLEKNGSSRNVLVTKDSLNGKRVSVLGYVISDELMGSISKEETARKHLKSNDEPTEHCYHCSIYSSIVPDNVIPAFIVEYHYLYKDNQYMTFGEELAIPDLTGEVNTKHQSAPSKFHTNSWQNLTALNVSKLSITTFGTLTVFENVIELDVSYNHLSSLQEIAKLFPNVTRLNAQFNEIASTNIGKEMKSLKVLSLKYNKLTKFLFSLHWLKKFCKDLDKLDIAFNPLNDVHNPAHMKYLAVKYFPELRKLDDEWLEDLRGNPMVYNYCMKDFPTAVVTYDQFEEIKRNPKVQFNGALCLQNNCLPISHCAVNDCSELICVYINKSEQFQAIDLDVKKTTLRWLTIKNNLLTSLDFTGFPHIEELDVSRNVIQSVSPGFESLRSLIKLNLSCNYILDLDGFLTADLPNLRVLNLSYNSIRKLEGLRNLRRLEELFLAGNEVRRCDSLQTIIKEWKYLRVIDLSDNAVEDEEMLRKFLIYHGTHLEYINGVRVSEEEITDANDTLSGTLNKNYLVKIYKPNQIKSLTELTVKKCGIRKTNFRDPDFQNLLSVNLESNALTSLSSLSYLKQLKNLCLTNNNISSFGDVKRTFDHLENLHLNFNNITDLIPLELDRCPKLAALFVQDNQLTTIEGVKELRRLQYLIVDRNKISTIRHDEMPLEALKELYVECNQIKDLTFLRSLRNLKKLFLAHNKVQDQSSIEHLGTLKKLTELTLVGNPICRLNSHYMLILTLAPKLLLLDGYNVDTRES